MFALYVRYKVGGQILDMIRMVLDVVCFQRWLLRSVIDSNGDLAFIHRSRHIGTCVARLGYYVYATLHSNTSGQPQTDSALPASIASLENRRTPAYDAITSGVLRRSSNTVITTKFCDR